MSLKLAEIAGCNLNLKRLLKFFLPLIVIGLFSLGNINAAVPVPSGYQLIYPLTTNYKGVRVYSKTSGTRKDYITVIDLRVGTLRSFVGDITASTPTNGNFVVPRTISSFYNTGVAQNTGSRKAVVAINGTFFTQKPSGSPVPIAFGLKADRWLMSLGYGLGEFPGLIKTFAFDTGYGSSSVQDYDERTFRGNIPDVVGGLDVTANKDRRMKEPIERTFVGVRDDNGDRNPETVIFFTSTAAKQSDADDVLRGFGTLSPRMMLDGGGSTGFILKGDPKIPSSRPIPQAFIIYEGK